MKKNKKKIAVVGAGFFGCTIALILSKRFEVAGSLKSHLYKAYITRTITT